MLFQGLIQPKFDIAQGATHGLSCNQLLKWGAMKAFKHWFFAWIFPWVPKRLLSRATGVGQRVPLPRPLAAVLVPAFAGFFKIIADEAEHPAGSYRSLDAFFTRRLK